MLEPSAVALIEKRQLQLLPAIETQELSRREAHQTNRPAERRELFQQRTRGLVDLLRLTNARDKCPLSRHDFKAVMLQLRRTVRP